MTSKAEICIRHVPDRGHFSLPLVATHSNAHALCPQPRNLTDQQLRAIRDSGGAVGVNFGNAFLRADGRRDSDTPLTTIIREACSHF
ncbi:Microsomal dipeptidase [Klebsiella pneumoniae]|uniref:Microsomal dipeptidase n=1 Tax=Klebsiella pneumoniae TaxID=573 RepID=A0A377WID4_KLEPN|nr:membrane dipeptidase family protein [Klebsiella pneumoniae]SQC46893.1 Microsomal dipeptidase [Klebsiella pneumoniae subsp. pneumoniae]KHF71089.1 proline dipeptidase [Klebsiella pneumoniae]STR86737.1 Microsomal dipeptidase [Klebsiella pneumoniae]STS07876.1 Microsomal dipeptidase [Klebsiella pneumoniae]